MTVEGVWTAEAYGSFGWENRGIFFLQNGQTMGGDNRMYCSGTYRMTGNNFEADWEVKYFGPPRTVFGEAKEEITLKVSDNTQIVVERGKISRVKEGK